MVESVAAETPALKHKIVLGPDTPEGEPGPGGEQALQLSLI